MEASHLIGGVESRAIVLVGYSPEWVVRFDTQHALLVRALGRDARRVDHIGSTAVPGLIAKPIIDIQLSVVDVEDEDTYIPTLLASGFVLRVREPGHRMVRTPTLDVHVHVCQSGSHWERRHLLFRDWLRHDTNDRESYGELKRQLASQQWADMNAYAAAKGPIIAAITGRAEEWAKRTAWSIS